MIRLPCPYSGRAAVVLTLFLLRGGPLVGQDVTGDIVGRVVSPASSPLPEVAIIASGPSLQGTRVTQNGRRGEFRFAALPVGSYTLQLRKIGYRPLRIEGIRVQVGRTEGLGDIAMSPEAFLLDELVVRARAVTIDPTSTVIGAHVPASILQDLPTDRDYQSSLVLLPHANQSFYGDQANIAGNSGLENLYYVDGVNVTTPFDATTGTRLPHNFITSIEVQEGGYEARYGRALGGLVNAVTHTGSNTFGAQAFGFFTHSGLTAEPGTGTRVELNTGSSAGYDVGVRVSGPVVRDRLWYSAAYNPLVERVQKEVPGFGWFDDKLTEHRFAAKLTWRAHRFTDLEFSLFGDPAAHDRIGPPPGFAGESVGNPDLYLTATRRGAINLALRARHLIADRALFEASVARSRGSRSQGPLTERGAREPLFVDIPAGYAEGGLGSHKVRTGRTTARLTGTAYLGRHTVTLGAEYEDNFTSDSGGHVDILRLSPATYFQLAESNEGAVRNRAPAAFAQLTWRPAPRVAVNGGVRWSAQYLTGAADSVVQHFPDQWQPRLGIVFQPGKPGSQKLFGSYGRFYQQYPLYLSVLWFMPWISDWSWYGSDPRLGGNPDSTLNFSTDESYVAKRSGLRGDYADEFTIGYERLLGSELKVGIRGISRVLHSSYAWVWDTTGGALNAVFGTPGRGNLSFLPEPLRKYAALELSVERGGDHRLQLWASYVLSRSYGNYTGLFATDQGQASPGANLSFMTTEQLVNSTGLLPNDRTHAVKVYATYRFDSRITVGAFGTIQSGTPLNDFGAGGIVIPQNYVFLAQRGSSGRTPTIFDLNLRFAYRTTLVGRSVGRVMLDLLHVGSPRRVVWADQTRYLCRDETGAQACPNPTFGKPLAHQPPMQARLGFEIDY